MEVAGLEVVGEAMQRGGVTEHEVGLSSGEFPVKVLHLPLVHVEGVVPGVVEQPTDDLRTDVLGPRRFPGSAPQPPEGAPPLDPANPVRCMGVGVGEGLALLGLIDNHRRARRAPRMLVHDLEIGPDRSQFL